MIHWLIGESLVIRWFIESSNHWLIASLIQWFTDSLIHFTASFLRCKLHLIAQTISISKPVPIVMSLFRNFRPGVPGTTGNISNRPSTIRSQMIPENMCSSWHWSNHINPSLVGPSLTNSQCLATGPAWAWSAWLPKSPPEDLHCCQDKLLKLEAFFCGFHGISWDFGKSAGKSTAQGLPWWAPKVLKQVPGTALLKRWSCWMISLKICWRHIPSGKLAVCYWKWWNSGFTH